MFLAITQEHDKYNTENDNVLPVVYLDLQSNWCDNALMTKFIIDENDTMQANLFILCKKDENLSDKMKFSFMIDNSRHSNYSMVDIVSLNDNTQLGCFVSRPNEESEFERFGEFDGEFLLLDPSSLRDYDMIEIMNGFSSVQGLHKTLRNLKTLTLGIELSMVRVDKKTLNILRGDEQTRDFIDDEMRRVRVVDGSGGIYGLIKDGFFRNMSNNLQQIARGNKTGQQYGEIADYAIEPHSLRKYEIKIFTTTSEAFFYRLIFNILGYGHRDSRYLERDEKGEKKRAFYLNNS